MGLDMYLSQKRHIANYAHDPEGQVMAKAIMDTLGISEDVQKRYASGLLVVSLPAAYWRKANAIHGWFVNNVQDGEDECKEHYVSLEQLRELRDLCAAVLAGTASKEELPPTSGFFFGNTDDDEWYRQDLQETIDKLTPILDDPDSSNHSFYYQSSW